MQARLRIAMARKSRMKFNNFPRSGSLCYSSALTSGKIVQTERSIRLIRRIRSFLFLVSDESVVLEGQKRRKSRASWMSVSVADWLMSTWPTSERRVKLMVSPMFFLSWRMSERRVG